MLPSKPEASVPLKFDSSKETSRETTHIEPNKEDFILELPVIEYELEDREFHPILK